MTLPGIESEPGVLRSGVRPSTKAQLGGSDLGEESCPTTYTGKGKSMKSRKETSPGRTAGDLRTLECPCRPRIHKPWA